MGLQPPMPRPAIAPVPRWTRVVRKREIRVVLKEAELRSTSGSVGDTGDNREDDPPTGSGGDEEEHVAYGGGFQSGGGMVEPDEFADTGAEPGLPNDALAEGLGQDRPATEAGTVDPSAAPAGNDTGDRMGDVAGYLGSDQVVGIDEALDDSTAPGDNATAQ